MISLIITYVYQVASIFLMVYIAAKTIMIKRVQKAQIEQLKSVIDEQRGFIDGAGKIIKLYDVEPLRKYVALNVEVLTLENEKQKKAIDKMVNEKDLKQRELLKFCIGFFRNLPNRDKAELLLNEYFPTNKELIKSYLKKLDAIKN